VRPTDTKPSDGLSATPLRLRRARKRSREHKPREKSKVMANINVTPLVDVVLVLLIIFMVVTPLIASGVPVELPKTVHHNRKPDDGKDIIISVTADKRIFMSGRLVADARDVTRLVEEERRRHPEKSPFVKGDVRTPYGAVRGVMEAVNKAGLDDVQLGTDEVEGKKDEKAQ
jgi:biopolymer transport protein ExbD